MRQTAVVRRYIAPDGRIYIVRAPQPYRTTLSQGAFGDFMQNYGGQFIKPVVSHELTPQAQNTLIITGTILAVGMVGAAIIRMRK